MSGKLSQINDQAIDIEPLNDAEKENDDPRLELIDSKTSILMEMILLTNLWSPQSGMI